MESRLHRVDDPRTMTAISRLKSHTDFHVFMEILDTSEEELFASMKNRNDTMELFRDQGAGQIIADIKELVKNAGEWSLNMTERPVSRAVP